MEWQKSRVIKYLIFRMDISDFRIPEMRQDWLTVTSEKGLGQEPCDEKIFKSSASSRNVTHIVHDYNLHHRVQHKDYRERDTHTHHIFFHLLTYFSDDYNSQELANLFKTTMWVTESKHLGHFLLLLHANSTRLDRKQNCWSSNWHLCGVPSLQVEALLILLQC